jgi:hypothetical protein
LSASLQSPASASKPAGAVHAFVRSTSSPQLSPSVSPYQVDVSTASVSSILPSQSSSTPAVAHRSGSVGLMAASLSLQSVASATNPTGALHAVAVVDLVPWLSLSASRYHTSSPVAPASSTLVSQSSSLPLQTSVAAGFTALSRSSQSPDATTNPAGAAQAVTRSAVSPYRSPSVSPYHEEGSSASDSSALPSQSSSTPFVEQRSGSEGLIEGSPSLQSLLDAT